MQVRFTLLIYVLLAIIITCGCHVLTILCGKSFPKVPQSQSLSKFERKNLQISVLHFTTEVLEAIYWRNAKYPVCKTYQMTMAQLKQYKQHMKEQKVRDFQYWLDKLAPVAL
jgi:hypothetical protein